MLQSWKVLCDRQINHPHSPPSSEWRIITLPLLSFVRSPPRPILLFDMLTGRRDQAVALLPEFRRASSEILLLFFLELLPGFSSRGCLGCVSVYSNPPFPGCCRRTPSSRNPRFKVLAFLDRLSGPECPSLLLLPPKERPNKF